MQKRARLFQGLGGVLVLLLGAFVLVLASFANGPNRELHFYRSIPSDLPPDRLDRHISALTRWPLWFYSLAEVKEIGNSSIKLEGFQNYVLKKGDLLSLTIDPKKGSHKKFNLTVEVMDYVPTRLLQLKVLDDSSGRLPRLFDQLEWKIEIEPQGQGSIIRGSAIAHTAHWKSRIFGGITERILMNQVFYPNLIKLAELKQPFSVDQGPRVGSGGGF